MKSITIILTAFALLLSDHVWADSYFGVSKPKLYYYNPPSNAGNSSAITIQSATQKIAIRFRATSTEAVSIVNVRLGTTGTVSGMNWKMGIFTDNSGVPGAILGGYTAEFSFSGGGWVGEKSLATNTGALTLNSAYWLVVEHSSGTVPDASNYIALVTVGAQIDESVEICRKYNGTDWTTIASINNFSLFYAISTPNSYYYGNGYANGSNPGTDIFGVNRQGIRFKVGTWTRFTGIGIDLIKTGSPNDLVITVYEDSVPKYSETIPAATITSGREIAIAFGSSVFIKPNSTVDIVLKQSSDGGTDANDYDLETRSYLLSNVVDNDYYVTTGTGDTPLSYTTTQTQIADMWPYIDFGTDIYSGSPGYSFTFVQ